MALVKNGALVEDAFTAVGDELGLLLVSPDTSPRGDDVPDDPDDDYDFGLAAGFYLNATEAPWSRHYHMYDYVTKELPIAVFDNFPVAKRAAGHQRVVDVRIETVIGRNNAGNAALCVVTVGLAPFILGNHQYRQLRVDFQGAPQSSQTAPDDEHVSKIVRNPFRIEGDQITRNRGHLETRRPTIIL